MKTREDLLKLYYNNYRFIEEDINKFQEILFSGVKNNNINEETIRDNLFKYIVKLIRKEGLINMLEKGIKSLGIEKGFMFFNKLLYAYEVNIKQKDLKRIIDNYSYNEFFKKLKKENESDILNYNFPFCIDSLFTEVINYIDANNYTPITGNQEQDYIRYIQRFPVLSAEEEKDLFNKYKNGDSSAFEEIINCNLRLVFQIANRCRKNLNGMTFMDYIQDGNMGLMRAVEKFEPDKGFKFSTYATWWIKQGLDRAYKLKDGLVWIPLYRAEQVYSLVGFKERFEIKYNRPPTDEEIMKGTGWDQKTYDDILLAYSMKNVDTLDRPISTNARSRIDEDYLIDFVEDKKDETEENLIVNKILNDELRSMEEKAFENLLTEREADVLRKRFGFDTNIQQTLAQVGKDYNVTREYIRQIETKALGKLKAKSRQYIVDIDETFNESDYNIDYIKKIQEITNSGIIIPDEIGVRVITKSKTGDHVLKCSFICNKCGYQWKQYINHNTKEVVCPKCLENKMGLLKGNMKMQKGRRRKEIYERLGITITFYNELLTYLTDEERNVIERRKEGLITDKKEIYKYELVVKKIERLAVRHNPNVNEQSNVSVKKESKKSVLKHNKTYKAKRSLLEEPIESKVVIKGNDNTNEKVKEIGEGNIPELNVQTKVVVENKPDNKPQTAIVEQKPNNIQTNIVKGNDIIDGDLANQYGEIIKMVINDPIMSQKISPLECAIYCHYYGICGFPQMPLSTLAIMYNKELEDIRKIVDNVLNTLKEYLKAILSNYENSVYSRLEDISSHVRTQQN